MAPTVFPMLRRHYHGRSWEHELEAARVHDFDPMIHYSCFDGVPAHNHIRFLNGSYVYEGRSYWEDLLPGVTVDLHVEREEDSTLVRRSIGTPDGTLADAVKQPLQTKQRYAGSRLFGSIRGFWGPPERIERLVKTPDDLPRVGHLLTMPTSSELGHLRVIKDAIGDDGLFQVDVFSPIDDFAEHAVGLDRLRDAFLNDRSYFDDIIDVFWAYQMKRTEAYLQAGVESVTAVWIACGASSGWTVEQFREVFLPRLKEHVGLVHSYDALYDYWEEFKVMDYLPMLLEAGVDTVHSLVPPPQGDAYLEQAKRLFGDHICLRGNMAARIGEEGTPSEVEKAVRLQLETGAPGGRYILSPSNAIGADWPEDNIAAFFRSARRYGRYAEDGSLRAG